MVPSCLVYLDLAFPMNRRVIHQGTSAFELRASFHTQSSLSDLDFLRKLSQHFCLEAHTSIKTVLVHSSSLQLQGHRGQR